MMMDTTEFRLYLGEIVDLLRDIKELLEESQDARKVLEGSTKSCPNGLAGSSPAPGVEGGEE